MDLLEQIKADQGILESIYRELYGEIKDVHHCRCPVCEHEDSLSLKRKDSSKSAGFKCFKCDTNGSVFDLVMLGKSIKFHDAKKLILDRFGNIDVSPLDRSPNESKPKKVHGDLDSAIAACLWGIKQNGKRKNAKFYKAWTYKNADDTPQFSIARFDFERINSEGELKSAKQVNFISKVSGGWISSKGELGTEVKTVLYGLPDLIRAVSKNPQPALHIVEGEKCAERMKALGLAVTTSQGGSGRASETDWSPVVSFEHIVFWPDVDVYDERLKAKPGEKYVQDVMKLIMNSVCKGQKAPQATSIDLSQDLLSEGEDVFDLIAEMESEGYDPKRIVEELISIARDQGVPFMPTVDQIYPNQPTPFNADSVKDTDRETISNFKTEEREGVNKKGDPEICKVPIYIPSRQIVHRILKVGQGWPVRLRAKNARSPSLFMDQETEGCEGDIRFIDQSEDFGAFLHLIGKPKFRDRRDFESTNFATMNQIFREIGKGPGVKEYIQPEIRPHVGENGYGYPDHYYAWKPPKGYQPTGKYLCKLLEFWGNVKNPASRAILAAAFLTPGAVLPYGRRPMFIIKANQTGSGKTTLVESIGKIWGGTFGTDLSIKSEDELRQRLLTYEALFKRVVLMDNLRGIINSTNLEALVTQPMIDGKRMYTGDASRPNIISWFITTNEIRITTDLAHRIFVIELDKPDCVPGWDMKLHRFIETNMHYIVADCAAILASPCEDQDVGAGDRWADWVKACLFRACTHRALKPYVGDISVKNVLIANRKLRDQYDADKLEGVSFDKGLIKIIVERDGYIQFLGGLWDRARGCDKDIWIPSRDMEDHWQAIFGGRKMSSKTLVPILDAHVRAHRIISLSEHCRRNTGNGFWLLAEKVNDYLEVVRQEYKSDLILDGNKILAH